MDRFEDELRHSLRRQDPPAGFAERILSRKRPKKPAMWRWLAIAATAVILLVAGLRYERQREERIAGEKAKNQVLLALRITQAKLQAVEKQLIDVQR